jgi:hypothetical protein
MGDWARARCDYSATTPPRNHRPIRLPQRCLNPSDGGSLLRMRRLSALPPEVSRESHTFTLPRVGPIPPLGVFAAMVAVSTVAAMNNAHRSFRPLSASLAKSLQSLPSFGRVQPRAELAGLEVKDSSFDEWLSAGGDRRERPRVVSERDGVTFTLRKG